MPMTLKCPKCDVEITAGDEDELVRKVTAHARDDHGRTLPPKHILWQLRRQRRGERRSTH
jgi:predicted small metal-binding protein